MNYLKSIANNLKLLIKSFSSNYDPPGALSDNPQTLKEAIQICSEQGKLLIVHMTKNGEKINVPLDFSPMNYMVYTTPFNSREAFDVTQGISSSSLPYAGLYFCSSSKPQGLEFLQSITTFESLNTVSDCFESKMNILINKQEDYRDRMMRQQILQEQNQNIDILEQQIAAQEQMEKEQEEEDKRKRDMIESIIDEAQKRFNKLSPEPDPSNNDKITIKAMLPVSGSKIRSFLSTDPIQSLFDWLDIDFVPSEISITFGFPQKTIRHKDYSILQQSFKQGGFMKNDTITISLDEEDEEEEEEEKEEEEKEEE